MFTQRVRIQIIAKQTVRGPSSCGMQRGKGPHYTVFRWKECPFCLDSRMTSRQKGNKFPCCKCDREDQRIPSHVVFPLPLYWANEIAAELDKSLGRFVPPLSCGVYQSLSLRPGSIHFSFPSLGVLSDHTPPYICHSIEKGLKKLYT